MPDASVTIRKLTPLGYTFYQEKVRCHNRQIYKSNTLKGEIRKRNQAAYEVKGFHLFERISYKGKECFIYGRWADGYIDLHTLDGKYVHKSACYKNIRLLEFLKFYLTGRRGIPLITEVTSLRAQYFYEI